MACGKILVVTLMALSAQSAAANWVTTESGDIETKSYLPFGPNDQFHMECTVTMTPGSMELKDSSGCVMNSYPAPTPSPPPPPLCTLESATRQVYTAVSSSCIADTRCGTTRLNSDGSYKNHNLNDGGVYNYVDPSKTEDASTRYDYQGNDWLANDFSGNLHTTFTLASAQKIWGFHVWNQNEYDGQTTRDAKLLEIQYKKADGGFEKAMECEIENSNKKRPNPMQTCIIPPDTPESAVWKLYIKSFWRGIVKGDNKNPDWTGLMEVHIMSCTEGEPVTSDYQYW